MNAEIVGPADSVYHCLQSEVELLERFRQRMAAFFGQWQVAMFKENERRNPKRRPPIGLRLIAAGEPLGKVVTTPRWDPQCHHFAVWSITCELLVEEPVLVGGVEAVRRKRQITVSGNDHCGWRWLRKFHKTGLQDTSRVVSTIRDFMEDSKAVLARSHGWCCVCGRKLTDGLSRSRGIGPECIKRSQSLLLAKPAQPLLCQESPGELFPVAAGPGWELPGAERGDDEPH
jgi:hypothetical protein